MSISCRKVIQVRNARVIRMKEKSPRVGMRPDQVAIKRSRQPFGSPGRGLTFGYRCPVKVC